MSFLDELIDNVAVVNAAATDALNPVNWWNGEAPNTARVVEEQMAEREGRPVSEARIDASKTGGLARIGEAAGDTVDDVADKAKKAGDFLGEWGPWLLGGVAVLAVAFVAAPYVGLAKGVVS